MIKDLAAQIKPLLQEAYNRGKNDGLSTGYGAAQRIMLWYAGNEKLIEPHTDDELKGWSEDELETLKKLMTK